jgi:hypothetical protein
LPFGHDPVLDADVVASEPVGPTRDVAGGEDARNARFEIRVHADAAIQGKPRLFSQRTSQISLGARWLENACLRSWTFSRVSRERVHTLSRSS